MPTGDDITTPSPSDNKTKEQSPCLSQSRSQPSRSSTSLLESSTLSAIDIDLFFILEHTDFYT